MPTSLWIAFNVFVLAMLVLDLAVFHRKAHEVRFKEAVGWSIFWIALALAFNVVLWHYQGTRKGLEFLTGYLIEKSLSVDNLFIFYVLFSTFHIKPQYQHKILFWGILGALIMRGIFIAAGVKLIQEFRWTIYIFGVFLIYTGIKMGMKKPEDEGAPATNKVITFIRKFMPVTEEHHEGHFFVKSNNRWVATPLFVVLVSIEFTDLVFALDSIPAVLAITLDPFIVYTSNVFAILGLRALFFAIAGALPRLYYLHYGLSAILSVIGLKMLVSSVYHVPILVSLGVTMSILVVTVVASLLRKEPKASAP